jgi:hypothetical protein
LCILLYNNTGNSFYQLLSTTSLLVSVISINFFVQQRKAKREFDFYLTKAVFFPLQRKKEKQKLRLTVLLFHLTVVLQGDQRISKSTTSVHKFIEFMLVVEPRDMPTPNPGATGPPLLPDVGTFQVSYNSK